MKDAKRQFTEDEIYGDNKYEKILYLNLIRKMQITARYSLTPSQTLKSDSVNLWQGRGDMRVLAHWW